MATTIMLMNPATGSVDTAENWAAEGHTQDNAGLIEVVSNIEGEDGYDESYGEWRPNTRRPGRPAELGGGKRVNVYLDAESLARAAELGNSNISEGIRKALKLAERSA